MRRRLVLTLAVPALLLAGCSSGSSGKSGTSSGTTPAMTSGTGAATGGAAGGASAAADTIVIKNFSFSPGTLTVAPGTKVTVANEDSVTHTVTSSSHAFDTGDIGSGASATFTAPSKAGSYPYICTIHPFMHGTLTVS